MIAASLWGLLGIFGTFGQRAGLTAYDVAWWRAVAGAATFGMHTLVVRARLPRGRDLLVTAVFGLVAGAVFYASYQIAVATGGAALASVLLYTAPAFVAIVGVTLLGERPSPLEAGAVVFSVVGVALVAVGGGGGVRVTGIALAAGLTAGASYSLYYLYGRIYYRRYDPAACLTVALTVAAVTLTPLASPALLDPATLQEAWPWLAAIGVLSTYVAYLAHSAALRRLPATPASVVATVEPVIAAGLAAALLGERPGGLALLGGLVVLGAATTLALASRGSH